MKNKTNEEIFENVRENGCISEREINLLKNRSNNERRDVEIIREATPEDFTFCGFYDLGRYGYHNFTPLYDCGGMEYYNDGGKIQVVG